MHFLQGFKTIIFNVIVMASTWFGANSHIELIEDNQLEMTTTLLALGNIGLRLFTKTPVGKKDRKSKNWYRKNRNYKKEQSKASK